MATVEQKPDEWLTQKEVMETVGCGRTWLYELRKSQQLVIDDDFRRDWRGTLLYRLAAVQEIVRQRQVSET